MYPWLGFLTPPLIIVIINFEPNFLAPRWRKQNSFPLSLCKMLIFISSIFMHQRVCSRCQMVTFLLLCACLCVSSKNLGQSRQSHTGCIYLTFLHCAFSNVSSNGLPEKMQNRIGCICLTFRHCALSNVSSNGLPEQRHSHIGCICSDFSPLCVLKCLLKLLAWAEAKSHWLHLFGFSPLCVFKCFLKSPAQEEA